MRAVTGVPVKFLGTGEHIQDLEPFNAEQMAGRILGQGDIAEIARRAMTEIDQDEMRRQQEEIAAGQFTLENFRDLLRQTKRLGSMSKIMSLIPGMGALKGMMGDADVDQDFGRLTGMIDSMTPAERHDPDLIDQSRRRRIAAGAGVEPHEINDLVKQFDTIAGQMKRMMGLGMRDRMRAVQDLQKQMTSPGGLARQKVGTGKRLTSSEKARIKKDKEREMRRMRRKEREGS